MRTSAIALILLCTLAAFAQAPAPADPLAAADAAFARGDHDEALRLYEQTLTMRPNELQALVRAAMLRSWRGDFEEAVRQYDRVLAVDASNSTARMERAKVLSWSGQSAKAVSAFREILAKEPGNVDARIGLARVLSWSGQQPAAREAYESILATQPNNVEAMVGVAQTYAWSGNQMRAREWYSKVLATEPERREAELGIAYVDLAEGDFTSAARRSMQLHSRYPQDKDILELRTAVQRASRPVVRASTSVTDDIADNQVRYYGLDAAFALPRRSEVTVGYGRYDITDNLDREGTNDNVFASLLLRPTPSQRLVLRAGADRLDRTDGSSRTEMTGRASWVVGVGSMLEASFDAERTPFRATTTALDRSIMLDIFSTTLSLRPARGWRLTGSAGTWQLSDDNQRTNFDAGVYYSWPVTSVRVTTGYAAHYHDFDFTPDNGYFAPQDSLSQSLSLELGRDFKPVYVNAFVESGLQEFELNGVQSDREQFLSWGGLVGVKLSPVVALEFYARKSDAAVANPSGYESDEFAVRFRVQGR
jgi:tetratricopeptide (TPR) repeat protein